MHRAIKSSPASLSSSDDFEIGSSQGRGVVSGHKKTDRNKIQEISGALLTEQTIVVVALFPFAAAAGCRKSPLSVCSDAEGDRLVTTGRLPSEARLRRFIRHHHRC
jgi:hypothetical protein